MVFVFILAYGVDADLDVAAVPARSLALLIVLTTAVSMIVSSLYPRFRDMAIIWAVLATVLFYATPVLYPIEIVPETLRDVILLNPLAPLFELARKWIDRPDGAGPGRGRRRLAGAAAGGRDLRWRLRARRLGVPARGAADRRGAVMARGVRVAARRACWCSAWLGVMERDPRLQERGVEALRPGGGRPSWRAPRRTCARARLLNPDTAPDVGRALALPRARARRSVPLALLEDVLRARARQPDRVGACSSCSRAGATRRPPARALAAQRRLDPVNARRR